MTHTDIEVRQPGVVRAASSSDRRPRHLTLVARQFDYWLTVYKRTWRGSVIFSFINPLLYLAAMGMLLGGFVDASSPNLGGAPSYLHFIAPGLLAAHAMQIAMGEVLWPVHGMIKWNKTYFGMISTPLRVVDVVGAHMAFTLFRVATTCAAFMLALTAFGVYSTWWGVAAAFAVQLLVGLAFATPLFCAGARATSDSTFSVIMRVVIMPLFLFSGAFFPIDTLAQPLQWLAWATPLWHGVELTRGLMLGGAALPTAGMAIVHLTYLSVLAVIGGWLSVRILTRRLIS